MVGGFFDKGYCRFEADPALGAWVAAATEPARAAVNDPRLRAKWLVCEDTWFIGVDALDNDAAGAIHGVALEGAAVRMAQGLFGKLPLHRAQISALWPGYPRAREGESAAALRYRQKRDAAHLDGLKAVGVARQRRIDETHAWILGIPLNQVDAGASPMVVWEGSHSVMREALQVALRGMPEARWGEVDLSAAYQGARRRVFDSCRRVELSAKPGEAYLLHRLCLHGVAPWKEGARAGPEGRMVAYFRPEFPGSIGAWLSAP